MSTTKQPEALTELRDYLRSLETDHSPDGWPAVRMRDITALLDDLDNARSDNQVLRLGYTAARLEIESLQRRVPAGAGCARSHPHENMDSACRAKAAIAEMRNMSARGAEATAHDLDRFVSMIAAARAETSAHPGKTTTAGFFFL